MFAKGLTIAMVLVWLLPAAGVVFGSAGTAAGADLSGLKICLDPGHGAYPTIKPFETIINLKVGFDLVDYLEAAGADTVIITRTDNIQNPSLSQREYIANSNNVDWFNSIHHNAFDGTANYSLVLYEELYSGDPEWPEAVTMSGIMGEDLYNSMRTTTSYVRGDRSFLGFNLGVLNDLLMPGELTEASFFDYTPEKNRLRNDDYLTMEARALLTSFLDYFEADPLTTGHLSGIVIDEETGDPVDGVTATLWPDSLVYVADDSSNGLFLFDDLEPDTYWVTVSKEGYNQWTDTVQVQANSFARLDFELVNEMPPTVTATVPDTGDTGIFVFEDIQVTFSRKMDQSSAEQAFLFAPVTTGTFTWDASGKQVTFDPDDYLEPSTDYTVTVEESAQDIYGHDLDGDGDGLEGGAYTFGFRTTRLDTTGPQVVSTYPASGEQNALVDGVISVEFDEPIDQSTIIPQNVILKDGSGVPVPRSFGYAETGNHGVIFITPADLLNPGETYTVTLNTWLKDLFHNELEETYQWSFTTSTQSYQYTTIDDFEDGTPPWWDPEGSGSTMGTDPDSTTFSTDTTVVNPATGSTASGRLDYLWDPGAGSWLIRDYFPPPDADAVHFDTTYALQIFLYGDGSHNRFRFCVDDGGPAGGVENHEVSQWVTIDWVGWRLVQWDLGSDPAGSWLGNQILEGTMRVDSFQMTYNDTTGAVKGTIWVDDLRLARPTTGVQDVVTVPSRPVTFELHQNYPNPFNAETSIPYRLTESGPVRLQIFNVTGQRVSTLVDEIQSPGIYTVRWDGRDDRGSDVASGIYFCHLQAGSGTRSRKMNLIR
jgi:N-acetylmuramoyl-L-alanine amidase